MYRPIALILKVAFVALFAFTAAGCGAGKKDFTPEDFKTVKKDMNETCLLQKLGKPSETLEALGTKRHFWETNGKYYSVSVKDGKVIEPMEHGDKQDYDLMKGIMQMGKSLEKK